MKRTKSVSVRLSGDLVARIESAAKYAYKGSKTFIIHGLLLRAVQGKEPYELYQDAKIGFGEEWLKYCSSQDKFAGKL